MERVGDGRVNEREGGMWSERGGCGEEDVEVARE